MNYTIYFLNFVELRLLAIPGGLIEDTNQELVKQKPKPLYTWKEIREMIATGLIYPASNSLSHKNLATINSNEAYQEICVSKRILSVKLENISEILIYPFGAYTNNIQAIANSHYRYVMRIGDASNSNWDQKVLYRINVDQF